MRLRTIPLQLLLATAATPVLAHVGEGQHLHPHIPVEDPSLGSTLLLWAVGAAALDLLGSTVVRAVAVRRRERTRR
jgi:hypothetical protein